MDAEAIGPTDPDEHVEVSVMLRPRHPLEELEERLSSGGGQPLSREEFVAEFGADPADVAKLEDFARQHGLTIVESSPERRTVRLAGRAADIASAFGVQLGQVRSSDGATYRAATAPPRLPDDLKDVVQGVFGLDTRPVARHYMA